MAQRRAGPSNVRCTIVRLEKAATIRLLHDEPAFSELFLSYLLSRNIRIEDLADQLFNSSEKRSVKASTSVMEHAMVKLGVVPGHDQGI